MQRSSNSWQGIIREFRELLPDVQDESIVTLNEGNTPLIESSHIVSMLPGGLSLFFKFEGLNPTCSFKDRGMTLAVSKAKEAGSKAVICASTGNTSASAAAYAAQGGLSACVIVPKGKVALGKLSQAMMHGAKVIEIEGNFDEALSMVREISAKYPITMVNSLNPYRIEGQKTGAYEVCNALGQAPTYHFIPVGNAGNITAYWRGYGEFNNSGRISNLPKMMGFQAAGAAPIVKGHPIDDPQTIATAIRIGNPASWKGAEAARDESGGVIKAVTDEEILEAYTLLAGKEGVFCEPASAASLAGVFKMAKRGIFSNGDVIVCTLTGHGLKDPDCAIKNSEKPVTIKPSVEEVVEILGL
ncbi:MAG: threonine synthase [Thermodesulfobacteriota bacterium]